MIKRMAVVTCAALTLGGCMTSNSPPPQQQVEGIWIRADGQSARNNPALAQQFAADKAGCTVNAEVNRICMSQHGYVLVPANQAEAAAAQLRAKAGTAPAPAPAPGT